MGEDNVGTVLSLGTASCYTPEAAVLLGRYFPPYSWL